MGGQQYCSDTVFRIQSCWKNTKITVGAENDEVTEYLHLREKGWKQVAFLSLIFFLNSSLSNPSFHKKKNYVKAIS